MVYFSNIRNWHVNQIYIRQIFISLFFLFLKIVCLFSSESTITIVWYMQVSSDNFALWAYVWWYVDTSTHWPMSIYHKSTCSMDIGYYDMPAAHSLLWLVRSWPNDHLKKLKLGCNITFQHSDSELSGSFAQFSTWTSKKENQHEWIETRISEEIRNGPLQEYKLCYIYILKAKHIFKLDLWNQISETNACDTLCIYSLLIVILLN